VVLAMPGNGAAKRENAAGGAARRRLAERRKALGLTQEALADAMGVERTTVVRWERGETAPLPLIRPGVISCLAAITPRPSSSTPARGARPARKAMPPPKARR
jgi:DNA-binding XRE family transcriptional regulator